MITSARYAFKGDVSLDRHTLFTALTHVIHNERALSTQIQGDDTRTPTFVRLDTVDLSRVVEYRNDDSSVLNSIMESCWLRGFETASPDPLWRLVVLLDNTVIFAYHHAIGDGQSGLAFHRSLLSALNHPVELPPATSDIVSVPPTLTLLPPVEEVVKTSVSLPTWCRQIFGLLAPRRLTAGHFAWTGNNVSTTRVSGNNIRIWEILPEEATLILQVCREHKSTLTSFLHTVSVMVISYLLASKCPSEYRCKTVSTSIPISLRRFTNASADAMCDHVSTYHTYSPLVKFEPISKGKRPWTNGFSWEASSKVATELRKKIETSPEIIGLFKFLYGRYQEFLEGQLGKKRSNGVVISNTGVFPLPEETRSSESFATGTEWRIDNVIWGQADATLGAAIKVNVVGSPSGSIGIAFTWGDGAVNTEFAEAFVEEFQDAVKVIISKGKPRNDL